MFTSIEEILVKANSENKTISRIMIETEMTTSAMSEKEVRQIMQKNLDVMENAITKGLNGVKSTTGLTGYDAVRLQKYIDEGKGLSETTILNAATMAIASNETNAAMGVVCANPTAGSAGTVPGVLFSLKKKLNLTKDQMIDFLFCAGAFGVVTGNEATIAGAEGGCQAEVGTASAMAAAAAVEVSGGTPEQSAHAFAIALSNMLGLVCDPVAGLVEIPCIKRNAAGATNALVAADMALAGIINEIPADEVIEAMFSIGNMMPSELRETAEGGLAITKTGRMLYEKVFGKSCNGCKK